MSKRSPLRQGLFWTHLVLGLLAAIPIFVMSFTGVVIAFEHELLAWIDADVTRATPPEPQATPRPLEALLTDLRAARPEFAATHALIPRAPDQAYELRAGRSGRVYLDPYTGDVRDPASTGAHDVLHAFEAWHRWLGASGEWRGVGKLVNGVGNLIFLLLAVTGLYLWLPKRWRWAAFRPRLWFDRRLRGRARDLNWHNTIAFWTLPVLVVLTATAVVFSFRWAHDLVFQLAGEDPALARGPAMLASPPVDVPPAPPDAAPVRFARAQEILAERFPTWETIAFQLAEPPGAEGPQPLRAVVFTPAPYETRGRIQVDLDPVRGDVLQVVDFHDRSAGVQARIWIRFLHTGEAFGLFGKLLATLATALSLVLVYTGVALSYRRFFKRPRPTPAAEPVTTD